MENKDINNNNFDQPNEDLNISSDNNPTTEPVVESVNDESYSNDTHDSIYCSKCGDLNNSSNKFCKNCGNKLSSISNSFVDTVTNSSTYKTFTEINSDERFKSDWENRDMINFIQKRTEYYIPKFKQMQEFNKTTSWNWSSFFLGDLWFLYRKMYALGFGLIALTLILSYIPIIGGFVPIASYLFCGLYGNALYLKHVEKNINNANNMSGDIKDRYLLSSGGVNIILPTIIIIGFLILVVVAFICFTLLVSTSQSLMIPFMDIPYFYY